MGSKAVTEMRRQGGCRGLGAGHRGCGQLCVFSAHFGSCKEDSVLGLET